MTEAAPVAKRSRIDWLDVSVDGISILFSVLLAFAVQDWREARNQRRETREAVAVIDEELAANATALTHEIEYYATMARTLDSLRAGRIAVRTSGDIPGWRGITPASLSRSAYEASLSGNVIGRLGLREATRVGRVYAYQQLIVDLHDKGLERLVVAGVVRRMFAGDQEALAETQELFKQGASLGRDLLKSYAEVQTDLRHCQAVPSPAGCARDSLIVGRYPSFLPKGA